jgi:hypothetical protein
VLRIYSMYNPLKVFFVLGGALFLAGFALGLRYLFYYFVEGSSGHVQSLILSAILLILGFQILVIGLAADLIAANRRLSEEILYRLRRLESSGTVTEYAAAEKAIEASHFGRARR